MATAYLTCPTCSAEFLRTHGRQRYCGPTCRADEQPRVQVPCTHCGKQLIRTSRRYRPFCDTSCYTKHAEVTMERRGRPKVERLPKPAYDPRSALRRAVESGTPMDVIAALRSGINLSDTGCWLWSGTVKDGYPVVTWSGKGIAVHRLAIEAKTGMKLGTQAAHHICANTRCVNPDHIAPVTAAANTAEMMARTYMVRRITELETELARLDPGNPLLREVSVSLSAA